MAAGNYCPTLNGVLESHLPRGSNHPVDNFTSLSHCIKRYVMARLISNERRQERRRPGRSKRLKDLTFQCLPFVSLRNEKGTKASNKLCFKRLFEISSSSQPTG
ncbi:hypothetical protein AVEN_60724-1 [Araneus ventricosus]|uniref:Uncharacterized protein n=1 Tax=Araneus ventricosus TaxID=182803 RepID=A0A4Y2V500_ARAVE|nr:hypothetical protein AVEN_60724-1 [Araneus ventricosus]